MPFFISCNNRTGLREGTDNKPETANWKLWKSEQKSSRFLTPFCSSRREHYISRREHYISRREHYISRRETEFAVYCSCLFCPLFQSFQFTFSDFIPNCSMDTGAMLFRGRTAMAITTVCRIFHGGKEKAGQAREEARKSFPISPVDILCIKIHSFNTRKVSLYQKKHNFAVTLMLKTYYDY